MTIVVDTSVLLNILDVPGENQQRAEVAERLPELAKEPSIRLLLPLVAVVEAGNHIAHLADGRDRRSRGERLARLIEGALARKATWALAPFPEPDDLRKLTAGLRGSARPRNRVRRRLDHRDLGKAGEAVV
jgi:hypothetical protein